jgi:glycosyltransferase involved in cell wall biosynthesis
VTRVIVHLARGREWRGGEFQVLLLARTLAGREGLAQQVITAAGSRLATELAAKNLLVVPLPWTSAWDPRAIVALIRQLNALRHSGRQPLLHAHDSHALGLALLARLLTGTPVVATRRSVTRPGALWRRADHVIAISEAVAASLRDAGVPPALIAVVPSAVAPEEFREVTAAPPLSTPPHIVAIGAATAEKGHSTLREAIALLPLPRPRLTIMSDGIDEQALASASLLVQPSLREALGTAVLLAMARGIPVIASHTGGLVELLAGDAGVLVPPGQPRLLAEAITRVLQDGTLRDTLVRNARRRVEQYGASRMADQVTDVYASVLSKH